MFDYSIAAVATELSAAVDTLKNAETATTTIGSLSSSRISQLFGKYQKPYAKAGTGIVSSVVSQNAATMIGVKCGYDTIKNLLWRFDSSNQALDEC